MVHTSYRTGRSESAIYAIIVWTVVALGILLIVAGMSQPLLLLVISGSVSALMMFLYSGLLIRLNRRLLDAPLRPGVVRIVALVVAMIWVRMRSSMNWENYSPMMRAGRAKGAMLRPLAVLTVAMQSSPSSPAIAPQCRISG